MKFTRFLKLRKAIANIDANFIMRNIERMEAQLTHRGQAFDAKNTAVTEEGIFHIDEQTGLTTKVALYITDYRVSMVMPPPKRVINTPYDDREIIKEFHEYHLLRCNGLTQAESNRWKHNYQITQRLDGTFYYRLMTPRSGGTGDGDVYQEIDNQKLFICKNCLIKVNSLFEGVHQPFTQETFELKYFFDYDLAGSWCRYDTRTEAEGLFAGINPKDWREICEIRKAQARDVCESCERDLSDPLLRKYLHIHQTNVINRKMAYVKLECLCISCLAELAEHAQLKGTREYNEYLDRVGILDQEHEERRPQTITSNTLNK